LVEDTGSGQSLIQELKYQSALPIIPVSVDRDKIARAQAVTPLIEAGKVFLPELAPWGRRLFVIRADSAPPKLPDIPSLLSSMVSNSVASSAHRYQVLFGIIAGVAAKLFVVNFQV